MTCTCIVPAITQFPFHRCRGQEICVVCGSSRGNEYWGCPSCAPIKTLDPDARDGRFESKGRGHRHPRVSDFVRIRHLKLVI